MTHNMPSSMKMRCKSTESEKLPDDQNAFLSFFFSKLCESFTMVFAQNSSTRRHHFQKRIRIHTNYLAMKHLLFKITELEIWLCA